MLETFIAVALYFGAGQKENQTFIDRPVLNATEDSLGYHIYDIPPSKDYVIKLDGSTYIIKILGQDQNGGD